MPQCPHVEWQESRQQLLVAGTSTGGGAEGHPPVLWAPLSRADTGQEALLWLPHPQSQAGLAASVQTGHTSPPSWDLTPYHWCFMSSSQPR